MATQITAMHRVQVAPSPGLFLPENVLEARTTAGQTTLLVRIAHHVAINHGLVLFVSLEMKPELKYIPDADSGRAYGPYSVARRREARRDENGRAISGSLSGRS